MIYLYSGTPGSGKSLHAAKTIYFCLKRKNPVICNFELRTDYLPNSDLYAYYPNRTLEPSPACLIDYARRYWSERGGRIKEGQILLVIDEAQQLFGVRTWNAKGRDLWIKFFCEHRKYGFDIILISQFDKMLDKQLRALLEYETIHRKMGNYGLFGKILGYVFSGGRELFVSILVWAPLRERLSSDFFVASKKYYRLYDTFALFDTAQMGKAAAAPMSPPGCAGALPEQGTSAPDGGGGEGEAPAPSVHKSKWVVRS